MYEDCDIYKTIAREVGEELYHSSELLRKDILEISKKHKAIYVNGHRGYPTYICYPVPISELASRNFVLNPKKFEKNRFEALRSNPSIPESYYSSIELKYFQYEDLPPNLSYRLKRILRKMKKLPSKNKRM